MDSDTMRSNLLVTNLFKQAIEAFAIADLNSAIFYKNFEKLKSILDEVRADHVRLDTSFNDKTVWENREKAPCTYIEIFQNQNFNMSIFVLKPGFTMPLHDHPRMYGLLKVLSGTVRVTSFNRLDTDSSINECSDKSFLAEISDQKICDKESESCILTPETSNYHEIECIDGPSAFLDILAPPYSSYVKDSNGDRICHYYKVLRRENSNLVQLLEIPAPSSFYCDQAKYLGPVLI